MNFKWKRSAMALAITAALVGCDDRVEADFELQLLHFADVDGGRDIIGNAPRFSALVDKFRTEYSQNTLLLSSGDNWIPGPEYNIAAEASMNDVLGVAGAGRAHIAYLNALGVQASVFGNHEFDLGTAPIASILQPDDSYSGAEFPYLSVNIDFSTDPHLGGLVAGDGQESSSLSGKIAESTVITIEGEKVGVVGATTPTLANISSPGDDVTIIPSDSADLDALASEIQASVDALIETGVNKVILLSHMQQIAIEQELAPLLSGVDIIVAGGSNTILADENDRLRDGDSAHGEYPILSISATDEPVLIVNTDGDYTYLGRLLVGFDENGVVITDNLDNDNQINGTYAADDQGMAENGLSVDIDAISGVSAISSALTDSLSEVAGNVFGISSVYLNGEAVYVRTEETNLGNLTADANLAYARDIDETTSISIKNGGGIRGSIGSCAVPAGSTDGEVECNAPSAIPAIGLPAGGISQLDIESTLRFNNSLTLVTLTGQQLKEVIEHSVSRVAEGSWPGSFGQFAGLRFSFDASQTAQVITDGIVTTQGSRVVNMVANDALGNEVTVVRDGEVVAPNASFRAVTLAFLASGYFPFPSDTSANVVELLQPDVQGGEAVFADNGSEQDALAEYLIAHHATAESAYTVSDSNAENDIRIQNLNVVASDTVLQPN